MAAGGGQEAAVIGHQLFVYIVQGAWHSAPSATNARVQVDLGVVSRSTPGVHPGLAPEWHHVISFPLPGAPTADDLYVEITVFDETHNKWNDHLGHVAVDLTRVFNVGPSRKWSLSSATTGLPTLSLPHHECAHAWYCLEGCADGIDAMLLVAFMLHAPSSAGSLMPDSKALGMLSAYLENGYLKAMRPRQGSSASASSALSDDDFERLRAPRDRYAYLVTHPSRLVAQRLWQLWHTEESRVACVAQRQTSKWQHFANMTEPATPLPLIMLALAHQDHLYPPHKREVPVIDRSILDAAAAIANSGFSSAVASPTANVTIGGGPPSSSVSMVVQPAVRRWRRSAGDVAQYEVIVVFSRSEDSKSIDPMNRQLYSRWQRFSKFVTLHKTLLTLAPKVRWPSLPGKTIFKSLDPAFLNKRVALLSAWLQEVFALCPRLVLERCVCEFIGAPCPSAMLRPMIALRQTAWMILSGAASMKYATADASFVDCLRARSAGHGLVDDDEDDEFSEMKSANSWDAASFLQRLPSTHVYASLSLVNSVEDWTRLGGLPGVYYSCEGLLEQLEKDLPATDPGPAELVELRKVCRAFILYRPGVPHVPGLNFIALWLLRILKSGQDAFWMLVTTVTNLAPKYFDHSFIGARMEVLMVEQLLPAFLPQLHRHLQRNHALVALATCSWVMRLFTSQFPSSTVLRLWDWLVWKGRDSLVFLMLGVLAAAQEQLMACEHPVSLMAVIQSLSFTTFDADTVINTARRIQDSVPTSYVCRTCFHDDDEGSRVFVLDSELRAQRARHESTLLDLNRHRGMMALVDATGAEDAAARALQTRLAAARADESAVQVNEAAFRELLCQMTPQLKEAPGTVSAIFRSFVTSSGTVDVREFAAGLAQMGSGSLDDRLRLSFEALDTESTGTISQADVKAFLRGAYRCCLPGFDAEQVDTATDMLLNKLDVESQVLRVSFDKFQAVVEENPLIAEFLKLQVMDAVDDDDDA